MNIPYHYHIDILNIHHFRRGVLFVWSLVYKDVHRLLIRQITALCKKIRRQIYLISFHSPVKERPRDIPYQFYIDILNIKHLRRGVFFVLSLVCKHVHRLLIRQTSTLCKITSKKDIFNSFSQSYQGEAYNYALSFLYQYIKYQAF